MVWRIKIAVCLRNFLYILYIFLLWAFLVGIALWNRHENGISEPLTFSDMLPVNVILLALSLPYIFRILMTGIRRCIKNYLKAHPGISMELLKNDFLSAKKCGIGIWIGGSYLFVFQSTQFSRYQSLVIRKTQIAWAYPETETMGVGVRRHCVHIVLANGTKYRLEMSKRQQRQLMAHFEQIYYVVTEYRPEYAYLFWNEREAFLEMRYSPYINHSTNGK